MNSIFIIGNCHLNGLIRSTRFFDPTANVDASATWSLASRFANREQCLEHLGQFDAVFTMRFNSSVWPEIDSETLLKNLKNVILYPTVTFSGFHPDIVYIFDKGMTGSFLPGPLGPYNSALAFYGYCKGYNLDDTVRLFQVATFEKVGYFDAWSVSVDAMLEEPEAKSFNFETHLLSWVREGCFMHNPQHPKLGPITDIAREMLPRGGFPLKHKNPKPFIQDDLLVSYVWPVYPEIASHYGLQGEYIFKRDATATRWPEFMSLRDFVAASHLCFAEHDLSQYYCDRVEAWLAQKIEL